MSSTRLFQNGLDRQIALIRIGELAVESVKCEKALNQAIERANLSSEDQDLQDLWDAAKFRRRCFDEKKRELAREVQNFIEHDHANGGAPGHTEDVKE